MFIYCVKGKEFLILPAPRVIVPSLNTTLHTPRNFVMPHIKFGRVLNWKKLTFIFRQRKYIHTIPKVFQILDDLRSGSWWRYQLVLKRRWMINLKKSNYISSILHTNDGGEDEYTNQVARNRENVSMKRLKKNNWLCFIHEKKWEEGRLNPEKNLDISFYNKKPIAAVDLPSHTHNKMTS